MNRLNRSLAITLKRLTLFTAALVIAQADAHHSFGMFDRHKTITLQGTVKTFEFKNPHAWLWITVPNKNGGGEEIWGLETAGPSMLNRMGITRHTFKTGDKITIDLHPLVDGRPGGEFVKAVLADGQVIDAEERRRAFSSGEPE